MVMKTRVLMLGPGPGMASGISAVVETLMPVLGEQVELHYFITVRGRPFKESGKLSLRNMALAVSGYLRFLYTLCRFRPRIIHLHTSQGLGWLKDTIFVIVGKILRRCIVLHVHAASFDELYGNRSHLIQAYTRKTMALADAVIAVSEEWSKYLANIIPPDRILVFRNCIDVYATPPCSSRRLVYPPKALLLGSVGPRKGAFDLLEAMGKLKSAGCALQLWLAGYEEREGDQHIADSRLRQLKLEDTCELLGTVNAARKAQLLNEASVFVLPSYNEGLPMAILEGMAAGLPVVATTVGGIPEVVKDGDNGFLLTPGNIQALADRLAKLADDRLLRERMGRRSREISERELDIRPYAKRLVALYDSLITSSKSG